MDDAVAGVAEPLRPASRFALLTALAPYQIDTRIVEDFRTATGGPHTAHTTNPVPLIMVSEDAKQFHLQPDGSLQDISPTILSMLGFEQPKDMTGRNLRRAVVSN